MSSQLFKRAQAFRRQLLFLPPSVCIAAKISRTANQRSMENAKKVLSLSGVTRPGLQTKALFFISPSRPKAGYAALDGNTIKMSCRKSLTATHPSTLLFAEWLPTILMLNEDDVKWPTISTHAVQTEFDFYCD